MLRNRQHSRNDWPIRVTLADCGEQADFRVPALTAALDRLDLHAFLYDPEYRRRLNDLLDTLSDDEFDSFERQYTRRLTLN